MKNVVHHLTRVVVVLAVITTAGLASAAYDFVDIRYPGATSTQLLGINNRGLVVGNAFFPDGSGVGFVYDPKEQTFTDLPPMPECSLNTWGINESGVIVGHCTVSPNRYEGFILKRGTYTRFAHPGFEYTYPRAIGITGLVTGFAGNDPYRIDVGFIYDPARETFTDIAFPDMYTIIPQGVNARGRVVGSVGLPEDAAYPRSPVGDYGFVREPNGAVTLFRVNGQPTKARGINDAGVIAGFTQTPSGSWAGFVGMLPGLGGYREMTDVELIWAPFAVFATYVQAIDDSRRVVGTWVDADDWHGFIATPVRQGRPQ